MTQSRPNIAILYPGEMGAALAARLHAQGHRVFTTLQDRGDATARRCHAAGIEVLPSLADVVHHADVVFSIVPPAAAEDMAGTYCDLAHLAPAGAVYVDVNSIGPELIRAMDARVTAAGRSFVDAAINGLAKNLTTTATLFLSGARAPEIAQLFAPPAGPRVQVLGAEPGNASAMKMLLSGLSKGICALYTELALAARSQGMVDEFNRAAAQIYPGVMTLVERMLPTYAQHAARRATETREVEETAKAVGVDPRVLTAVRELHDLLAAVPFGGSSSATVASLIEHLAAHQLLTAEPSAHGEIRTAF
jgi:3-hydroxyisobutyrate dehydrogenase-like beta-hydroxyacid dehydrogenase